MRRRRRRAITMRFLFFYFFSQKRHWMDTGPRSSTSMNIFLGRYPRKSSYQINLYSTSSQKTASFEIIQIQPCKNQKALLRQHSFVAGSVKQCVVVKSIHFQLIWQTIYLNGHVSIQINRYCSASNPYTEDKFREPNKHVVAATSRK